MGKLRRLVRSLERTARGERIAIPQKGGSTLYFTRADYAAAYCNVIDRVADPSTERHPLLEAARNSSDPRWRSRLFHPINDLREVVGDEGKLEDLSEQNER